LCYTAQHHKKSGRKMKLKWIIIAVSILIGASIFVSCTEKKTDVPELLIGKWTTSEPRYHDRFIEITKETLVYGLGGDKEDVYPISGITKDLKGDNILYTISFESKDGHKFTRSFYYAPCDGGRISLKHEENVAWHK
jgi:hypothetical protein